MRKLFIATLFLSLALIGSAQWINKTDDTSFGFIAPAGAGKKLNTAIFPVVQAQNYAFSTNDTVTIEVKQFYHLFVVDSIAGPMYVFANVNWQVTPGAMIMFTLPTGAVSRKVYFKTGFYADSVTVEQIQQSGRSLFTTAASIV